jgi:hypothetical protein
MDTITINDLAATVRLIDAVTSRGAIRGEEMSQVGALRDKLVAFINAARTQNNASEDDMARADAEADSSEED